MIYSINQRNKNILEKIEKTSLIRIKTLIHTLNALSQDEIKHLIINIKNRVQSEDVSLNNVLEEVFALTVIAIYNVLNIKLHDVQILGGIFLHQNNIVEMQTGEGKTLVATLPAVLNALSGKGVHVITVNDYLVVRDATEMGKVYEYLGLTVGYVVTGDKKEERQIAYKADITYLTSNEAGFDYLRDNLSTEKSQQVQRELHLAIIDEVDSILLDEAVIPLVISEAQYDSVDKYILYNNLVETLILPDDVLIDEKVNFVYLKDSGYQKIETCLLEMKLIFNSSDLYEFNVQDMFYLNSCIQAHFLYKKNKDYLLIDDEILIVSEKTGRAMEGRRWSEGLHQAIEAKEKIDIKSESINLATTTLQNFFKLYKNLCGMTGTALTEASEFFDIYKINTIVIPTNKPVIRIDHPDLLYLNEQDKFNAIVKKIADCNQKHQPVLIGTSSIESSEYLSTLLSEAHIIHKVLNAKYLKKEAAIIAQAGAPDSVTIATNMAGRGTDIILGGNISHKINASNISDDLKQNIIKEYQDKSEQVKAAGGLFVIIAERHKSRRIDNQLRGRCARQGEPGESQFYVSLEDPLIRLFVDKSMIKLEELQTSQGSNIVIPFLPLLLSNAQKIVEKNNFMLRKQLLEYDDIINQKRVLVYKQRQALLDSTTDVTEIIKNMHVNYVKSITKVNTISEIEKANKIIDTLNLKNSISVDDIINSNFDVDLIVNKSLKRLEHISLRDYKAEKYFILQALNTAWQSYINSISIIRRNANLKSYAQQDPKNIFEKETNEYFNVMVQEVREESLNILTNFWEDALALINYEKIHENNPLLGTVR